MIQPSAENLERKFGSKYALAMAVSKRARQIREGAPILVECKSRNPITIAMEEIASGKIDLIVPTHEQLAEAERQEGIEKPAIKEAAPEILPLPEQEAASAEIETAEQIAEVEEQTEEPAATAEESPEVEEPAQEVKEEEQTPEAEEQAEEPVAVAEESPEVEEPAQEVKAEEQETSEQTAEAEKQAEETAETAEATPEAKKKPKRKAKVKEQEPDKVEV